MSLYEAGKAGTFTVTSTPDIQLLENIGLIRGTVIRLKNRYALGGPVLVQVNDAYTVALGKDIAKQIRVS